MHDLSIFKSLAITSNSPIGFKVDHAKGVFIYDDKGNDYIDLISGIGVSTLGHKHPVITEAIKTQADKYLHVMCYGELAQDPQIELAELLTKHLPAQLNKVYLVNTGSEAVEGALKTAKRYTGRTHIITVNNAYHGSTHGALTATGNESLKNAFRPLLPNFTKIQLNNFSEIDTIDTHTACVLIEPILGEAGVQIPEQAYIEQLAQKCKATGTLLIFDEVQTGIGRTGKLWAFEHYNIIPDILITAKALGGGLPIGAFIASEKILDCLTHNPILGHITTFGGHPLSCATAIATLKLITENKLWLNAPKIEQSFLSKLKHPLIKEIRSKGAMIAIDLKDEALCWDALWKCYANGLLTDSFLFCPTAIRIAPPLIITEDEINMACNRLIKSLNQL